MGWGSVGKRQSAHLVSRKPWVLSQETAGWGRKEKNNLGVTKEPGGIERKQCGNHAETKLVRTKGHELLYLRARTGTLALAAHTIGLGCISQQLWPMHRSSSMVPKRDTMAGQLGTWLQDLALR